MDKQGTRILRSEATREFSTSLSMTIGIIKKQKGPKGDDGFWKF